MTHAFFDIAPEFLVTMFGASHVPPRTDQERQLRIVERVTIAFLDRHLKGAAGVQRRMAAA